MAGFLDQIIISINNTGLKTGTLTAGNSIRFTGSQQRRMLLTAGLPERLKIKRAFHTMPSPVKDMQIDRRCFQAFMSEEVLYSSNIVAVLQQMCGERVTECMGTHFFDDTGTPSSQFAYNQNRCLSHEFVEPLRFVNRSHKAVKILSKAIH